MIWHCCLCQTYAIWMDIYDRTRPDGSVPVTYILQESTLLYMQCCKGRYPSTVYYWYIARLLGSIDYNGLGGRWFREKNW